MLRRVPLLLACVVGMGCVPAVPRTREEAHVLLGLYGAIAAAVLVGAIVENVTEPVADRRVTVDRDRVVDPDRIQRARSRLDRLTPGMTEADALKTLRLDGLALATADLPDEGGLDRLYLLDETRWIRARYDRDGGLIEAGIEGFGWNRSAH